nr:hypothetical protein [Chloroflexaceae bacterium]
MEKQRVRQHLDAIARNAGTERRNLWPTIQQKLNSPYSPQEDSMSNKIIVKPAMRRKTATVVLVPLLVLLLTGTALSAPAVREFMQQRFGIVLFPASMPRASSGEHPVPQGAASTLLGLEEAQQQVPFSIPQPGWLPEGMVLQEVWVGRGPSGGQTMEEMQANAPLQLELVYRPSAEATQGVFLQITQG